MDFLKEASNDEYSSLEALWMKKKILDLSSFYQPTKHSTLVLTKWNIIPIEILVSSFYFTQQPTLRVLSITKQSSPPAHCRQARSAGHPYHTLWRVQNISKDRHEAASLPAVPSYLPWSFCLVAADDYIQHTDNSSAVHALKVFHNNYRTLKRGQVCQPHPELCKGQLTEQAEYTK